MDGDLLASDDTPVDFVRLLSFIFLIFLFFSVSAFTDHVLRPTVGMTSSRPTI